MEFLRRVGSVLIRPRAAFADIAAEPRFEEALLLAVLYAALTGLGATLSSAKVTTVVEGVQVPEGMAFTGSDVVFLSTLGAITVALLAWLLVAAFVRGVSAAFGGRGTYRLALSAAGYAAIPLLATAAVGAALYALSSPYTVTVTVGSMFSVSTEFSPAYYSDPYLPWAGALGLLGPAACAPLWVAALREAEGLSTRRAAGALAVLYVIYYGLTLGIAALSGVMA